MDPLINEKGLPLVSSEQVISDITYDDDGTDIGSTINTGYWILDGSTVNTG